MKKVLRKDNNKGFTLAELLIVVAIIAVLVAIAIPIFTRRLESSREATDIANLRSAYAAAAAATLQGIDDASSSVSAGTYVYTTSAEFKATGDGMSGRATMSNLQGGTPNLPNGVTYNGYASGSTIQIAIDSNSNIKVSFGGTASTPDPDPENP